MDNKENLKNKQLETDIIFNVVITIQNRISKDNNKYQVMVIGIENEKTGELIDEKCFEVANIKVGVNNNDLAYKYLSLYLQNLKDEIVNYFRMVLNGILISFVWFERDPD